MPAGFRRHLVGKTSGKSGPKDQVALHYYTVSQKKQDTKLLPITSPNVNRFSKFFHWQTHW